MKTNKTTEYVISNNSSMNKVVDISEFTKFIKEKRKERKESPKEISRKLGISYELYRKIINGQKPTKKRDFVIALCIVLKLNVDDTNIALRKYNYMPGLDEDNDRDDELFNLIEEQHGKEGEKGSEKDFSISDVNNRLLSHNYQPLDIIDVRTSRKIKQLSSPFKVINVVTKTEKMSFLLESNESLQGRFDINNYRFQSTLKIYEIETKATYFIKQVLAGFNRKTFISEDGIIYNDIEKEKHEHLDLFISEVGILCNKERNKIFSVLNDTKNYKTRESAKIINNEYYAFIEEYNFETPELNEYYLMEYKNGVYSLSISNNSNFMKCYMKKDDYSSIVPYPDNLNFARYASLDDIENSDEENSLETELINLRKGKYTELKEKLISLTRKLKKKQLFIVKYEDVFDSPFDVIRYFNLENEFDCTYDDDFGNIKKTNKDLIKIKNKDGKIISISISDLRYGLELGLRNTDDIVDLKSKYKNLYKVIPNI